MERWRKETLADINNQMRRDRQMGYTDILFEERDIGYNGGKGETNNG